MKAVEAGGSRNIQRYLLIFRSAKNRAYGKIAFNWNVSGTREMRNLSVDKVRELFGR